MIRRDGDRMLVSGALTLSQVAVALAQGRSAIADGARSADLGEVGELDSSALALLLAWMRDAKSRGWNLNLINLPQGLTTIARLYGVADLLAAEPASALH
jgi:phospholipid transport system transporter-binding protein